MDIIKIKDLDTPAVIIDEQIVENNLFNAQKYFDQKKIALRPHVKTHKLPILAQKQLAAGAKGIACQKISEAEVFAKAGCSDILICYNILGAQKLERLRALSGDTKLTVVADSKIVIEGLKTTFETALIQLDVLVECDTGLNRCGIQTPSDVRELAGAIQNAAGLNFAGLMTYPAPDMSEQVQSFLKEAKDICLEEVGSCETISSGGTPCMSQAHEVPITTEYRPGTYIYNDRSLVERGACAVEDCALTVLTRVISRPTADRGIIDAGSKSLSSDLLGLTGYGYVKEYPNAVINALSEEHGHIDFSGSKRKPVVGELMTIIPNHACPVSNLFDVVHFYNNGEITSTCKVEARGCVQ